MFRKKTNTIILTIFLFFLSMAAPPVLATIHSTTIAQSQTNTFPLVEEAKALYRQGNFQEAAAVWQEAANQFANKGDRLNQAMALSNLSLAYQQLGLWQEATNTINQSLGLLTEKGGDTERRILAATLNIRGKLQREIGQPEAAVDTWKQAGDIFEKIGDRSLYQQTQINRAKALQDLGLYPRACQNLIDVLGWETSQCKVSETDLEKLANIPNSLLKFDALLELGNVLRVVSNIDISELVLTASLEVAKQLELPAEESKALSSLGNTARALVEREVLLPSQQQDFTVLIIKTQEALESYRKAVDLASSLNSKLTPKLNLFGLLLDSQEWLGDEQLESAVEIWRSLQQDFNNLPPSKTAIYARINAAEKLIDFVANKSANSANIPPGFPTVEEVNLVLEEAREDARILGNQKAEAYAVGTLGHLRETTGEWDRAETLTQQALNLAPAYENPVTFYQFSWQLGRIRKAKSETAEKLGNIAKADKNLYSAIAAYKNAFQTLQSLRGDLVAINPEVQFSFRDRVEPVYRQLISLNLQATKSLINQGKTQESQKQLKETRQFLESLQLAELNNFFRDACAEANPKAIDELAEDAAIIYPIILEDRLEVIVTLPGDRLLLITPKDASSNGGVVSQEKLTQTLIELRAGEANASLQSPGSGTNFLPLTQQLYDWLIRPVEGDLEESKIETLVFVLDGELRNVPMAVLHDGNEYLIEKYALALAPGLQLLNPQPLSDLELGAVIAGATDAPSFQQNNLGPLPAVEDELNSIAGTIPNQKQENQNFTQANLRNLIAEVPFPVVHLATHGQFSSNIDNTFILDWEGKINVGDLDTLLKREEGESAIELLVLSACETVAGDNRAALGLAGVAVRAGARSTVATLWTVDDRSTAEVMVEFYKQLAKGDNVSKAEALRRAQLALLKDSNYQHPFFWAPYVLVGNWQ